MPRKDARELLATARKIESLRRRRRVLRRQLKDLDTALRHETKLLKALLDRDEDRDPALVPSRVFEDAVGHRVPADRREPETVDVDDDPLQLDGRK